MFVAVWWWGCTMLSHAGLCAGPDSWPESLCLAAGFAED